MKMLLVAALTVLTVVAITEYRLISRLDAKVQEEIEQYVKAHPRVFYDATVQTAQADAAALIAERQQQRVDTVAAARNLDDVPVLGNPDGDVTVIMFSDYRCAFCRKVQPELAKLLEHDPGVRLVVLEYPVLGDASIEAARAALMVNTTDPEKYGAFAAALFAGDIHGFNDIVPLARNLDIRKSVFLDTTVADQANAQLNRNHGMAEQLGVNGTPAFVFGNELVAGALSFQQLVELVSDQRIGDG